MPTVYSFLAHLKIKKALRPPREALATTSGLKRGTHISDNVNSGSVLSSVPVNQQNNNNTGPVQHPETEAATFIYTCTVIFNILIKVLPDPREDFHTG